MSNSKWTAASSCAGGCSFRPERRRPAITLAHGYAGVKEHALEPFARAFADAGFVVLLHDHRGFGASEGTPRHDIDPWRRSADWRRAIRFLETLDVVDPARIGLWGTSYAGGHAIVHGATDRRLRCVVAQVPTISGYEQGLRRIPPESVPAIEEALADDDRAQLRGEPPRRQAIVGADPAIPASYRTKDAIDFYLQPLPDGAWENNVTFRSTRTALMYEPGQWIARVSQTPLLMVVATREVITLTDLELAGYERALQPKRLVTIQGGHFDPYLSQFSVSSEAAVKRFRQHLGQRHFHSKGVSMSHLTVTFDEGLATIVIDRPPQNRIGDLMVDELATAGVAIERSDARAVLLRGEGEDFSFGGDIMTWPDASVRELRARFGHYISVFNRFEHLPLPVVAEVQGLCFGGGLELALRADVIFAAESAAVGHPEQTLGIVTLLGDIYPVAERAGRSRASE